MEELCLSVGSVGVLDATRPVNPDNLDGEKSGQTYSYYHNKVRMTNFNLIFVLRLMLCSYVLFGLSHVHFWARCASGFAPKINDCYPLIKNLVPNVLHNVM